MSTAVSEPQELKLASREPLPAPEAPILLSERASRAVRDIINEQRLQTLSELAPDLVSAYKSYAADHDRGPLLGELAAKVGLTEDGLLAKLGAAAMTKVDQLPQEFREMYRSLAANGHTPTSAELAARAGVPEPELLTKIGRSVATILGKVALRLRVVGGGCSGFEHKLDLDPTINAKVDEEFEILGVPVAIDRRSLMYVQGVAIDYHNDLNRRGFSITNPNAKTTCGCGSSFSM